jgi:hypothetical protein
VLIKVLKVFIIYWNKYSGVRKMLVFKRILRDLPKLRRYLQDLKSFQSLGGNVDKWSIHLHEDGDFAGDASGHYFWQDLVVAQWVLTQKKNLVADIGSRLDGYVSHVASSQKVFVIDIRPIKKAIPNVEFIKDDILNYKSKKRFEIVTSLHTLEHIGLGRYGDPIDPIGHIKSFSALAKMTLPKGQLVVSFPIDSQTRVEFNGQRMVGYQEPLKWAKENNLKFVKFICLRSDDDLVYCKSISSLAKFSVEPGALGIYFFKKMS